MGNNILNKPALDRIKKIHKLSKEYNLKVQKDHQERLLEMMSHHVDEIKELINENNKHNIIETGDLIILCFELLIEQSVSIDDILVKCFERYENKLSELMEQTI